MHHQLTEQCFPKCHSSAGPLLLSLRPVQSRRQLARQVTCYQAVQKRLSSAWEYTLPEVRAHLSSRPVRPCAPYERTRQLGRKTRVHRFRHFLHTFRMRVAGTPRYQRLPYLLRAHQGRTLTVRFKAEPSAWCHLHRRC